MAKLPDETVTLQYKTRARSTRELTDASATDINIYDPLGVIRVVYDAAKLTRVSVGFYRYSFTIPAVVLAGDWRVNIQVTIGDDDEVDNIFFKVKEL